MQREEWFASTAHLSSNEAREIVRWSIERFGEQLVYPCSFGVEGMVLLHMISQCAGRLRLVTIDTGRLPEETHDLIQTVMAAWRLDLEIIHPDAAELHELTSRSGPNLFYDSHEARMRCCRVRRVAPLNRVLGGARAWMSGLRREQGGGRANLRKFDWDAERDIPKLLPIVDWSWDDVWRYVHEHHIPYNRLHDRGYTSIGCAPCTRAVPPGVDPRAGRWWWEVGMSRECGIHLPVMVEATPKDGRAA